MARRASAIKAEQSDNQGILLTLDAGSALLGAWLGNKTQGQVMVEAMNAMNYDALTIGSAELSLGLEVAKQRETEAKFPFLSANLTNKADQQPLFKPSIILERQGARIGIIGLSEPEASQNPDISDKITVLDPTATATKIVGEMRDKVDIVVVLSHLGLEADEKLAQAVPGIDIIVGGNTRQLMNEPDQVGNTLIVQQGYRGEWVGRLQATFSAQGVPSNFNEKSFALTPDYKDDPDIAALVKKWAEQFPTPTPLATPTIDVEIPTEGPTAPMELAPTAKP